MAKFRLKSSLIFPCQSSTNRSAHDVVQASDFIVFSSLKQTRSHSFKLTRYYGKNASSGHNGGGRHVSCVRTPFFVLRYILSKSHLSIRRVSCAMSLNATPFEWLKSRHICSLTGCTFIFQIAILVTLKGHLMERWVDAIFGEINYVAVNYIAYDLKSLWFIWEQNYLK